MKSNRWQRCAWYLFICLWPFVPAKAEIALRLGDIQADAWQAQNVRLVIADAAPERYAMHLQVERLNLPGGEWRDMRLDCPSLRLAGGYRCEQAVLRAETPYGPQQLSGAFNFKDAAHWQVDFAGLQLADGQWHLQGRADGSWELGLEGVQVQIGGLLALLPKELLPDWAWQGRLDAGLTVRGQGAAAEGLVARLSVRQAGYASPDGLQALEGMTAEVRLDARRQDRHWTGSGSLSVSAGQWYGDPVFIDLAAQPLRLRAEGRWQPSAQAVALSTLQASLGKLLRLQGEGDVWPLEQASGSVVMDAPDLAGLYPLLLQPLSYGTVLDRLSLAGAAAVSLSWRDKSLQRLAASLQDVHLEDEAGRFGMESLSGDVHWQPHLKAAEASASRLAWKSGHLYRIDFGASQAELELQGEQLRLRSPLELPLLAGKLRLPHFELHGLGGDSPIWWSALEAQDLSLPELSTAIDWPTLDGSLTVRIPAVSYASGEMGFDGELVVQAFDGVVRVNGLRLHDPFGGVPTLQAGASLRGLDLERLTRAFKLGSMSGRLDGDVQDLELVGWEPVRFAAELRTPPGDTSRHRISQRAVENLTALGNNGAAALSGTFLRFFESFAYDRLLLKVELEGQQARLDGIAHPDGGYYLVKGSGLPRIDVIGRNRQVAWRDLVARLKRIRRGGMSMQ